MKDLTGQKFGRLLVNGFDRKEVVDQKMHHYYWRCRCDCGKECIVEARLLKYGNTKSCGCLRRETITKHGLTNTKLYNVWKGMKSRCYNHNHLHYDKYGGRGISICEDWLVFDNFYKWATSSGYQEGLSIDRENNSGNYCPDNCRWSNQIVQNNNKRNNVIVEYNDENYTLSQLANIANMDDATLKYRIEHFGNIDKAIHTKVGCEKVVEQYDLDERFIKRWNSVSEAEKTLKLCTGGISRCCNGKLKSFKGYLWRYSEF
ncbi:hypothetical protein FYJ38_00310 [Clostridium sp. WB02_MRS01]|uniref:hypothetical protein n=1 Tax=Clostridium sp. WB02_MRS01 TaxID=2605777 RepID=UPI0012B39E77|nr:hypothetical protein [Clostridium sp. WB02_MRS01]MSS07081.1 hypothetical protein [Clostridium sp. WB02_MRS01]